MEEDPSGVGGSAKKRRVSAGGRKIKKQHAIDKIRQYVHMRIHWRYIRIYEQTLGSSPQTVEQCACSHPAVPALECDPPSSAHLPPPLLRRFVASIGLQDKVLRELNVAARPKIKRRLVIASPTPLMPGEALRYHPTSTSTI